MLSFRSQNTLIKTYQIGETIQQKGSAAIVFTMTWACVPLTKCCESKGSIVRKAVY